MTRMILNRVHSVSGTLSNIYDKFFLQKQLTVCNLKTLNNKYFIGRMKTPASGYTKSSMRYYTHGL